VSEDIVSRNLRQLSLWVMLNVLFDFGIEGMGFHVIAVGIAEIEIFHECPIALFDTFKTIVQLIL
jgi:hypothetical protein